MQGGPCGQSVCGHHERGGKQSSGALCRYGALGVSRIVSGLTVSNGLSWSPDGARFYLVDSQLGRIYSFDYNVETGVLLDQRVFKEYGAGAGKLDGTCTDCEGNLWVAFWGGARIECLRADGALLHSVQMPVRMTYQTFELMPEGLRMRLSYRHLVDAVMAVGLVHIHGSTLPNWIFGQNFRRWASFTWGRTICRMATTL